MVHNVILKLFLVLLLHVSTYAMGSFLQPDEAFKPYMKKIDEKTYVAGVKIAKEIYLYKSALHVKLDDEDGRVKIESLSMPEPVEHHGDKVYLESPELKITLAPKENTAEASLKGSEKISFTLSYQGCSEQGLCYEPYTRTYSFEVDLSKISKNSPKSIESVMKTKQPQQKSEQNMIADTIKNSSLWVILVTFFVFGLLLALTPCVFPMIPILSGVIISQGEGLTTKKAFALSVVYVLAMALAYAIAGVLSGYFGSNMQTALQTPWVVYSFAVVFVLLALSMFGLYELKLPDALVSKISSKPSRGGYVGVAIMGFLSALIVGPCVAAPLAGALVYIGQTGDALLGGIALFVMALGMGMPLILVGMSAGKLMPRPGSWMTMVNIIFGFVMLGVAVWMLSKVLQDDTIMLLYALLGLGFSVYFGALESGTHVLKRSIAVIVLVYSLAMFVGFMGGSDDMYKPLKVFSGGGKAQLETKELSFEVVESQEALDALLQKYRGKKVMLDFSAKWCAACKELEEKTFSDAGVQSALQEKGYILIRADLTKNGDAQKALSKKYGVFGPPVVLFMDETHNVLEANRIVGYVPPKEFLEMLP